MKKLLLETSFSKIYILVVGLISLLMVGIYFSYAMFTVSKEKNNAISIITGNLTYKLTVDEEEKNTLTVGSNSSKEFIINLSNPNNRTARYNLYYEGDLPNNVEIGYIIDCETNNMMEEKGANLNQQDTSGSSLVYKVIVTNESDNEVNIKLGVSVGLDYNDLSLPSNGHMLTKYVNEPNAPELDDNMIAVTYDGNNWVKADSSTNSWYNYDEQEWANAVTVSSSTRDNYLSADVGATISIDDIETMWVWIPKYSYTIGTEDGTNYYGKQGDYLSTTPTQYLPGEIDVKFVPAGEKDMCSAKYKVGEEVNTWYTPDAFTFGDEELSGIWVGKFETSSSNPSATNGGGNTTSLDAMIKPNVTSWRDISVSNAFNVSIKMNDEGNRYGFASNVDTHMMKNSEWAVVAYLSQSRYGKLGNKNYSERNKGIYQNKSDSFITGCSYGSPPSNAYTDYGCQYTYDVNVSGTGASTTGNIYGVYDMSGGAWEYVMGNYNDMAIDSGFSNPLTLESKYYDKYISNNVSTACNGGECLSHALSETATWYNNTRNMISGDNPWMVRSGSFENYAFAIIFAYNSIALANGSDLISFRLVMSPNI